MLPEIEKQILAELRSEPRRTQFPPAAHAAGLLSTKDYYDPGVFEAELSSVFARSWIPAARESECAEAGSYITVTIGRDSIAIVRGEGGKLAAFHNVCLHRGAVILREAAGRATELRCPYHQFTYSLDGTLISIPLAESFRAYGAELPCALPAVDLQLWGGWVWIRLARGAPELLQYLGALCTDLENWELEKVEIKERIASEQPFNWKIGVEAFLESLHVPAIHAQTVHPVADYRTASIAALGEHSRMAIAFRAPNAYLSDGPFGAEASSRDVNVFPRLNRVQRVSNLSYLIFPSTILNLLPNHFAVFRLFPLAPGASQFIYELYALPAASARAREYYDSLKPGYRKLVEEDLNNLPWIHRGAGDSRGGEMRISYYERRIAHFRETLRARRGSADSL